MLHVFPIFAQNTFWTVVPLGYLRTFGPRDGPESINPLMTINSYLQDAKQPYFIIQNGNVFYSLFILLLEKSDVLNIKKNYDLPIISH